MASIQINRGTTTEIENTPYTDGLISFDTDKKEILMDGNGEREIYGANITANPQGQSTEDLQTIGIGENIYNIPITNELNDLDNVNISNPTNNQVLKYDSTNDEWFNANESGGSVVTVTQKTTTGTNIADITVDGTTTQIFAPTSGGASSLSGLSDVNIVNPTDEQILVYDNTEQEWVNRDIVLDINDLDNVSITSPSNNQVLKYDSVNDVWKNANESGDVLVDRTFNVASTDWTANTDPTTETDYPYIAEITTSVYSNTSKPIWQMNGVGTIPTLAEQQNIKLILEAVFNSSGIVLYATDEPSVNLVLEVKGE